MHISTHHFYKFSGFHSLLIGLLPFFLPVILWERGVSLAAIAGFISLTGVSFIVTLWGWDRLRARQQWNKIIIASFGLELFLVGFIAWSPSSNFLVGLALLNGAYNCFYWSSQRAMFNHITTAGNTGKTYGNFQILVVILLKIGILAGGALIESVGFLAIALLSIMTSTVALTQLLNRMPLKSQRQNAHEPAIRFKQVIQFSDDKQSKTIFLLDGPLLYLESYFWVLSIYLLTNQNAFTLGFVVVCLALILSFAFYLIKNKIDKANQSAVFYFGLVLYAASWLLRGGIELSNNEFFLYGILLLIGFLTTFFRLVFNKRFYDIAQQNRPYRYLVCKSYYSQFGIVIFFGALAFIFPVDGSVESLLSSTYFWACPLALAYGIYQQAANKDEPRSHFRAPGKVL